MSMRDSVVIAGMTVGSVGLGASVGLEAGVTQLGAAATSWQRLRLNRSSLSILVGCGAAIGAAFNAPLAEVFYALELVIGGYAVAALVSVVVASMSGTLMSRLICGTDPIFYILSVMAATAITRRWFGYSFATWRFHVRGRPPRRLRCTSF